jgi:hypothetical protein
VQLRAAAAGETIRGVDPKVPAYPRLARGAPHDPADRGPQKERAVKKIKKISLSRETLIRLQAETDLRDAAAGDVNDTGPSCDIFRACTIRGWDC